MYISAEEIMKEKAGYGELLRILKYVAQVKAQRDVVVMTEPPAQLVKRIVVEAAASREPSDFADMYTGCGSSCESACEGPPHERGHRSHATYAERLVATLGLRRIVVDVSMRLVSRRPPRYEIESICVVEES